MGSVSGRLLRNQLAIQRSRPPQSATAVATGGDVDAERRAIGRRHAVVVRRTTLGLGHACDSASPDEYCGQLREQHTGRAASNERPKLRVARSECERGDLRLFAYLAEGNDKGRYKQRRHIAI